MPLRWSKSRQVEFDDNGNRADGAQAEFFLAGTTTALAVYSDAALTSAHTSPVRAPSGRWPDVFIPFDTIDYKEVASTSGGTNLWTTDNVDRADPVEAAASTVDATQLLQTGDWVFAPVNEVRTGFVRANGRTIGSATSGATERQNADTQNLFIYLWNKTADAQSAVVTGRGATAAADWAANKQITLPDCRGGGPFGLTTMGNADGANMGSVPFFNGDGITACSQGGANSHTLTTAQLPAVTPAGSIVFSSTATNSYTPAGNIVFSGAGNGTNAYAPAGSVGSTISGNGANISVNDPTHAHSMSGTINSTSSTGATGNNFVTSNAAGGTQAFTSLAAAAPAATTTGVTVASNTVAATLSLTTPTLTGTAITTSFSGTTITATFSGTSFGTNTAHNNVPKVIMGTFYVKL